MVRLVLIAGLCALISSCSGLAARLASADVSAESSWKDRPTPEEIQLVRVSWRTNVMKNRNIPVHTLLEMVKALDPELQAQSPRFKGVPIDELPSHPTFVRRAHFLYSFLIEFVVGLMDDKPLLKEALQRLSNSGQVFVPDVPKETQIQESIKYYLLELEHEEPDMTPETRQAWAKCLRFAMPYLGREEPTPPSGTSVLNEEELQLLRTSFETHSTNVNIAVKAFQRLFDYHPMAKRIIPPLADVPIEELTAQHPIMRFLAMNLLISSSFIVNNADNDEFLQKVLVKLTQPHFFVSYYEPKYQLDEWRRIFLETAAEEGVNEEEIAVWSKFLTHVHKVMADAAPRREHKKTWDLPQVSGKFKGLIRDSWAAAKRNSNIAPNAFLRMIDNHPSVMKMFPRLSKVNREDLPNNRDFLRLAYTCYAGLDSIVDNLDDIELVAKQMWKRSLSSWYVNKPNFRQHVEATIKTLLEVMGEELGDLLTVEQKAAWTVLFDNAAKILEKINANRPLTEEDKMVIRDSWGITKRNERFGSHALLKLLRAYPMLLKQMPKFQNVPLNALVDNEDFVAYGARLNHVLTALVDNIDDAEWRNEHLKGLHMERYMAPALPIDMLLGESGRILIDTIEEEMGPRFTKTTRKAWTSAARNMIALIMAHIESLKSNE